jgi:hypothetical protein
LLEHLASPQPSQLGQCEPIRHPADEITARHLDAPLVFEEPQRLIDDGEQQPDVMGNLLSQQAAMHVQQLQHQFRQKAQRQAAVGQCDRLPWRCDRGGCDGQTGRRRSSGKQIGIHVPHNRTRR